MNSFAKLKSRIENTNNLLCIGIDPVLEKLPNVLSKDINGIREFCFKIIGSTKDICSSYKINFAFFEQFGTPGYALIEELVDIIPDEIFTIADAKRGDIGNTSKAYAKSVFEYFSFDSVTVAPYMGNDSIGPFLEFEEKMVFLLALTSNLGASDFQKLNSDSKSIFKHVIDKSSKWADHTQLGYVVGATKAEELAELRNENPKRVFLIPGLGAQGGDAEASLRANNNGVSLFNVSRGVIYAGKEENYPDQIREKAKEYANILRINDNENRS